MEHTQNIIITITSPRSLWQRIWCWYWISCDSKSLYFTEYTLLIASVYRHEFYANLIKILNYLHNCCHNTLSLSLTGCTASGLQMFLFKSLFYMTLLTPPLAWKKFCSKSFSISNMQNWCYPMNDKHFKSINIKYWHMIFITMADLSYKYMGVYVQATN